MKIESIITDKNWKTFQEESDREKGCGYEERDWSADPLGGTGFAAPYNLDTITDMNEIKERIRERKAKKQRNIDWMNAVGLKPYHQGNTNFCWANGPTFGANLAAAKAGQLKNGKAILFSPASVAGPITNFKNVGGWGVKAVRGMAEIGIAKQEDWGPNTIDRRLFTSAMQAKMALNKATGWLDLKPQDIFQVYTCILIHDAAVSVAYSWWRHLVCAVDLDIMQDGSIGLVTANSGLGRDANGYTTLTGRKAIPDEAIALVTTIGA